MSATREPVRVLAVDDQEVFLDVAREVVAATPGFVWVGGARSGAEALAAISRRDPQLVLLDVRMPGMGGVETASRIAGRHPDVVVVLISVEDAAAASGVASCGAVELVSKRDFGPALLRRLWADHRPAPA
jgi:two-component system, NarL family, invasion response regulator UvrY